MLQPRLPETGIYEGVIIPVSQSNSPSRHAARHPISRILNYKPDVYLNVKI